MPEIIADPAFATLGYVDSPWAVITHKGVSMQSSVDTDGILTLDISGTSGANWHGELRYAPFAVQEGDEFQVSFEARAQHRFTFSIWLGQMNAPYSSLVKHENHFGEDWLDPEWQTFTHTWHPFLTEKAARLNFVLGQIDNVVEIRNVSLVRID